MMVRWRRFVVVPVVVSTAISISIALLRWCSFVAATVLVLCVFVAVVVVVVGSSSKESLVWTIPNGGERSSTSCSCSCSCSSRR